MRLRVRELVARNWSQLFPARSRSAKKMKALITTILTGWALTAIVEADESYQYSNFDVRLGRVIATPVVKLRFNVANTGDAELTETPRIHYQPPSTPIYKALGTSKAAVVSSGGKAGLKVILKQYDLAVFSEKDGVKILSKGEHRFVVRSSNNVNQLEASIVLDEDIVFKFKKGFSGPVFAKWKGSRMMVLDSSLTYTDRRGTRWTAPTGAKVNGATIPRYLWSSVGSPFVGPYRRASAIHDYFVGENDNPDPMNREAVKRADRMFYEACLEDGCTVKFASTLYAGVRFGTWKRNIRNEFTLKQGVLKPGPDDDKEQDKADEKEFWKKMKKLGKAIETGDLDKIDSAFPNR